MNHKLEVDDDAIVNNYYRVTMRNPLLPTESELATLRSKLPHVNYQMLSLHWLANRITELKKAGRLN
jgi:hypothetical protein